MLHIFRFILVPCRKQYSGRCVSLIQLLPTIVLIILCLKMRYLGENLYKGDVILSNHPAAGGSHLPDLTVITPVSDMC